MHVIEKCRGTICDENLKGYLEANTDSDQYLKII